MADPYANVNDLKDQGRKLTLITPSDSVDIPNIYKALQIGGTAGTSRSLLLTAISTPPVS
jgi:hypothetical protein